MARQIIVQEKNSITNYVEYKVVFWLTVPTAKQSYFANPNATSTVKDATTPEITALQNGSVVEEPKTVSYIANTNVNAIAADLVAKYNTEQTTFNLIDKYQYYGSYYDGSAWTVKGA